MTTPIVGIGKPGVPRGDVVSVQGVAGGVAAAVDATIVAPIPLPVTLGLVVPSDFSELAIDFAAAGPNTVIPAPGAGSGQRIYVMQMFFVLAAADGVTFLSGATALTGVMSLNAGAVPLFETTNGRPWFTTLLETDDFIINLAAGVQTSGRIYYVIA